MVNEILKYILTKFLTETGGLIRSASILIVELVGMQEKGTPDGEEGHGGSRELKVILKLCNKSLSHVELLFKEH